MIVAAVVLIVVGALFGLYLYMKSRKAQKNVSLLTENEEVD